MTLVGNKGKSTWVRSKLYTHRKACRLCGSRKITEVLSLEPSPPANSFVSRDQVGEEQEKVPLNLCFCEQCFHVQLLDVVDPEVMFRNYVYVSGTSPTFVSHFETYARDIVGEYAPPEGSLVVDIGSNDGTLLKFFKRMGLNAVGVDPATSIAEAAERAGIPTIPAFFNAAVSSRIKKEHGQAQIITANNVFAHADNLHAIVLAARHLLKDDGIFVFEVSYLGDVFEKTLFDTIYHEHLAYHSVKPLVPFFESNLMELIDVKHVDSHGGSIRCVVQKKGGPHKVKPSVGDMIRNEEQLGLDQSASFQAFADRINAVKEKLSGLLRNIKDGGKSIAGYGAPAKATTLMHHFQLGPDIIDFIVDDSPLKQNLFTPGFHIPVLPPAAIEERKPDVLLILAWNFAEPIMQKHAGFGNNGGTFIVPLPDVRQV